MFIKSRECSLDRRPWPQRATTAVTRPVARYLSRQAAHPHGVGGRLIGRLWVAETAKVNDAAIGILAPTTGEVVLEIGFGPGRTLGLLVARGATVTGIDVSEAMLGLAAHRNAALIEARRLGLILGDGVTLPLDTNAVDAVLSVHNIYFWSDPSATIKEIARVLRPGGRVLLVFRGGEHPLPGRLDRAVYRTVTTQEAADWLLEVGFANIQRLSPPEVPSEIAFVTAVLRD